MEILNLKDSVEKDSFFRKLPNLVEQLPRQIVLKKVSNMLQMKKKKRRKEGEMGKEQKTSNNSLDR